MVYLEVDERNADLVDTLNEYLHDKNNKVFILYYMDGCPACEVTKPEWQKLKNVMPSNGLDKKDIVVALINHLLSEKLKIGKQPSAYPTMRFIANNGKIIENYEDANLSVPKDRTIDSFVEWIKYKTHPARLKEEKYAGGRSKRNKRSKGGKWSRKYKRSIRCSRPKGFSQKQYCKYGRKKRQ